VNQTYTVLASLGFALLVASVPADARIKRSQGAKGSASRQDRHGRPPIDILRESGGYRGVGLWRYHVFPPQIFMAKLGDMFDEYIQIRRR